MLLARNTVVSTIVFAFGLALLWALVELGGVNKLVAAAIGFLASNSIHYAFGRTWIYRGTERGLASNRSARTRRSSLSDPAWRRKARPAWRSPDSASTSW